VGPGGRRQQPQYLPITSSRSLTPRSFQPIGLQVLSRRWGKRAKTGSYSVLRIRIRIILPGKATQHCFEANMLFAYLHLIYAYIDTIP
jgi:hypothetical protein